MSDEDEIRACPAWWRLAMTGYGYALLYFNCLTCGRPAAGNPDKVVSVRVSRDADGCPHIDPAGTREPICEDCARRANDARVQVGLAPFTVAPDWTGG